MLQGPDNSRFIAIAVALLWAVGCQPQSDGASGGSGGKVGSGGSGGGSAGGSGGRASGGDGGKSSTGGSAGTSAGGSGGKGGAGSGGAGGRSSGGAGGSGSGGAGGTGSGGAGGTGSGAGGRGGAGGSGGGAGSGGAGGRGGSGGNVGGNGGTAGAPGGATGGTPGGSGGTTSVGSGAIAVSGLKIEANPKNVLSAFVSWTTDKASDSVVQFGQGKYEWEVSDAAQVTSHRVLIIGMVASKAYQIKAMSSAGGATGSATGTFTTGALPATIPVATIGANDTTKIQPGWTLMNILKASSPSSPVSNDPAMAVIYDATGQPVWYYINGTSDDYGGATATYLTDKGILIGPVYAGNGSTGESPREVDFAGNTIWECKDPKCGGADQLTHDTIKLSNGNHIVLRWKGTGSGTLGNATDTDAAFEELDASGNVVWSAVFGELVPKPAGATGDWCHGNSITVDIAKDTVYINCRFMGLIKTTYKNPKSLVWYLPASYGKATGNMAFSPTSAQYSDTHDPEIHADGTILVFDNGGYASGFGGPTTTYHSRAVEYKIDENAKTATLAWEFPGTFTVDAWYKNNWYNPYYGDADRLANGNVLIAAGSVSANAGDARVFEVTKADGKVVWEFKLPASYGVYRADRIVPPLVKAITQ